MKKRVYLLKHREVSRHLEFSSESKDYFLNVVTTNPLDKLKPSESKYYI